MQANVRNAIGTMPPNERIVTDSTIGGLSGRRTYVRSGVDSKTEVSAGPFVTAEGTYGGVAWRQNANAQVVVGSTSSRGEEPQHVVLSHVNDSGDFYVVSKLSALGFGTKDFVDPKTWRIVREERIGSTGTTTTTYDDFRTTEVRRVRGIGRSPTAILKTPRNIASRASNSVRSHVPISRFRQRVRS